MVTFTCNACGSSLKKIKVEKHLYQCKTRSLSCIDCGKDFDNKSYNLHKQCITEDEKYGNKTKQTSDKPTESKGQIKQEQWVNHIRNVIAQANLQEPMKGMMNRLLEFSNIPKKKPKFLNFVNNCMKIGNKKYTEQMWELFNKSIEQSNGTTKSNEKNAQETESNKKREAQEEIIEKAKKIKTDEKDNLNGEEKQEEIIEKAKKIKTDEKGDLNGEEKQEEENVESYEEGKQKLKMNKIIKKVLKENDFEMPIKKLRKRVLKEFKSNDEEFDKEELEMKFEGKINSSKFVIEDGKVKLAKK